MSAHLDKGEIIALFAGIKAEFPHLKMNVDAAHPHLDLMMDIPKQTGLLFDVNLNLQGDELHLTAGCFWLEWFPCTRKHIVELYRDAVTGLLNGTYRILEYYILNHAVRAKLQRPAEQGWQTIGNWGNLGALLPLPRTTKILQNLPDSEASLTGLVIRPRAATQHER